jgi:hypothetical protein
MSSALYTIFGFLSVIVFPWPFWVVIAVLLSAVDPLLPLALGLFADTLYYVPEGSFFPLFTLCGGAVSAVAFFVRSRLVTRMM